MARRDRLDAILEAGARVLGASGYDGTSMRAVAESAGAGLATLYHHLAGKEDLLYQVQRRVLEAAVASAQAALATRGARERLRSLLTDHIRRVAARPVEAAILAGTLDGLRGDRARRVEELRGEYVALVHATSEGAVRRGSGRGREADARTCMLLGMADRLALDAARSRAPIRPRQLAARVLHVFLDGARDRRG